MVTLPIQFSNCQHLPLALNPKPFCAGKRIDKGQWIIVGIMAMHRKHWPQGERFLPERWMPGTPEHAAAPRNAFIPFGDGPRVCVGSRFALQEAKLTLVRIFQRLTLELAPFQATVSCSLARSWPSLMCS